MTVADNLQDRMRVACVGGVNHDIRGHASAPLERGTSNSGTVRRDVGGVAGNIARSLAGVDVAAAIFSVVGDDAAGRAITAVLQRDGVDTEHLRIRPAVRTSTYLALLDEVGELVGAVADMEAMEHADVGWIERIEPVLAGFDTWVVDTNLPAAALDRLLATRPPGVTVLADPVSAAKATRVRRLLSHIDVLTPDRSEAAALCGRNIEDIAGARAAATTLVRAGAGVVLLKLGADGLILADGSGTTHLPTITPNRVVDVTGAGDALAAGYLYGVAIGAEDPVRWGLAAASLTVESSRTVSEELSVATLRRRARADEG